MMDQDSLTLERRRERNRLAQRKHRTLSGPPTLNTQLTKIGENTKSDSNRSRPLECYSISSAKPYSEKYYPATSTNPHSCMSPVGHCQKDLTSSVPFGPSPTSNGADGLSTETCFFNEPFLAQTPEYRDLNLVATSLPLEDRLQFGPCTCSRDSDPSASPSKRKKLVVNTHMPIS